MGILSKLRRAPVDLEDRAPQTGVKIKDLMVLQQLVHAGADLTAPRHVLHHLYFDDPDAARTAADEAAASSFETRVNEPSPASPGSWSVVCERHSYVLSMDIVRDNTDYFESLAARFGGDFDGWEASAN